MEVLRVGAHFPNLEASTVGGGKLRLPEDFHGRPSVLIFYRGHW